MIFIVTLVALLIERFFDCSHLRSWDWYLAYQRAIVRQFASLSPYLVIVLAIIPFLIVVGFAQFILDNLLYGVLNVVFQIAVLLYCLGPKNLWADAFGCITALQSDPNVAESKLRAAFNLTPTTETSLHRHFLDTIFIAANARVFGTVFWFVVAGPLGAITYRAIAVVAADPTSGVFQAARLMHEVLNWLPTRVFTFLFALGGHFVQVLSIWREGVVMGLAGNDFLLTECGAAALALEDPHSIPATDIPERNAIALLDRAFVIFLILLVIFVTLI